MKAASEEQTVPTERAPERAGEELMLPRTESEPHKPPQIRPTAKADSKSQPAARRRSSRNRRHCSSSRFRAAALRKANPRSSMARTWTSRLSCERMSGSDKQSAGYLFVRSLALIDASPPGVWWHLLIKVRSTTSAPLPGLWKLSEASGSPLFCIISPKLPDGRVNSDVSFHKPVGKCLPSNCASWSVTESSSGRSIARFLSKWSTSLRHWVNRFARS